MTMDLPIQILSIERHFQAGCTLKYNDDGSLDLLFSHSKPKADMMNNWYPLPRFGVFNLTMRLYAPDIDKIESGAWKPPVERAEGAQ